MVLTPSFMSELGTKTPDFELIDVVSRRPVSRDDATGDKGLLVMFICRHCPFVKHVQHELARLGGEFRERGVGIVAISANDAAAYPDDAPESLREQAAQVGFPFPYLYDETQEVAKAFGAACTPDFFVYDNELRLAYRGQLDESRPGNDKPVTGRDLRAALESLVAGRPVSSDQKPSLGCNIKWRTDSKA